MLLVKIALVTDVHLDIYVLTDNVDAATNNLKIKYRT
jgi:hypothetical protein